MSKKSRRNRVQEEERNYDVVQAIFYFTPSKSLKKSTEKESIQESIRRNSPMIMLDNKVFWHGRLVFARRADGKHGYRWFVHAANTPAHFDDSDTLEEVYQSIRLERRNSGSFYP